MLMHVFLRPIVSAAIAFAVLLPASVRAQSTFTTLADFLAATGPSGVDSYDDLSAGEVFAGPVLRQAGSYAYTVAADTDPLDLLFPLADPGDAGDIWLSTEGADAALNFNGFSAGVRAIGGNFFATNFSGMSSGTRVVLFAQDVMGNSVTQTLSPLSPASFFGVSFDFALASLRLVAENDPQSIDAFFATANDLVLAKAPVPVPVPEPSTLWLFGGPVLLLCARKRMQRHVATASANGARAML